MSGLMGGLIGAGIGGLLFGHGFFGGGLGFGGFLGFLLQIFLLVLLVRFLIRRFRGPSPAFAGGPGILSRGGAPGPAPIGGAGGPAGPPPIQIGPQDYQEFERLLQNIQAVWSRQDLNALRSLATPEMLSYFAEQLAAQTSQGVRNEVTDVQSAPRRPGAGLARGRPRIRDGGDALLDDRRDARRNGPHR